MCCSDNSMEIPEDPSNVQASGDEVERIGSVASTSANTSSRANSGHQMGGGSKVIIADDVILWRRRRFSCGIIVVATAAWILFEKSGLSFLSISCDVLLILIVLRFLRANYAVIRNRQLKSLPELVLSEEMVNTAAASFRAKVNYMLLMAHDIAHGKDFKLFFMVAIGLWLLSVMGGLMSFYTMAYIGTMIFITVSALYDKFEDHVD